MWRAFSIVAVIALMSLLVRAARVGLAGDYVDPITHITAQDEALYANSSIRMAVSGNWLTPRFMERLALYKPPMLMWLSGLSARLLGVSTLTLRLPVALFCALSAGLIFLWVAELRSPLAGATAAALLVSNHLWHVLGGLGLTDGLLVTFYTGALFCLFSDPWLESRWALWGFSGSVAAGILTKSVAGVLPLGVLALYWIAAPGRQRPSFWRTCLAATLSLTLAAPWFAYQLLAHKRWFWTEHIGVEIMGFGAGAPPQTSRENQLFFYLMRLPLLDPVLAAVAFTGLFAFSVALWRRSAPAVLLASWIVVMLAAVCAFQYRNVAYLLPLMPALAILATVYAPVGWERAMAVLIAAAFLVKAATPQAPAGISFAAGTIQKAAPVVSDYCALGRSNELILVGLDDDLYASALPLPRLRYALVGLTAADGPYGMPFHQMGVTLSAPEFNRLHELEPVFRDRLRGWGVDSSQPIGTLILAQTPQELIDVIHAHPASDFMLQDQLRPALGVIATHDLVSAGTHFFLLSRQTSAAPRAWSCRM